MVAIRVTVLWFFDRVCFWVVVIALWRSLLGRQQNLLFFVFVLFCLFSIRIGFNLRVARVQLLLGGGGVLSSFGNLGLLGRGLWLL